jgi:hypothetical protein
LLFIRRRRSTLSKASSSSPQEEPASSSSSAFGYYCRVSFIYFIRQSLINSRRNSTLSLPSKSYHLKHSLQFSLSGIQSGNGGANPATEPFAKPRQSSTWNKNSNESSFLEGFPSKASPGSLVDQGTYPRRLSICRGSITTNKHYLPFSGSFVNIL